MARDRSADDRSLGASRLADVDRVCDRFEAELRQGRQPAIEVFLAEIPEARPVLFRELLRIELEFRIGDGKPVDPSEYEARFPAERELIAQVVREVRRGHAEDPPKDRRPGQDRPPRESQEHGEAGNRELAETIDQPAPAPGDTGPDGPGPDDRPALTQLGRFEILGKLGQGAFGSVYRAHDPQLDRVVALKVPRSGMLVTEDDHDRFFREARTAAQLRHPHIVPVYDAGRAGEVSFIAAAFVAGRSLREVIKERGKFPHDEVARLVSKMASALHYAHAQGIVHRDVKPENTMIDESGEPHVMDFGLARRFEGESLRTQEGAQMGTPAYMSPEQVAGKSHLADARSDLWSLGVILYELLTGGRPFISETRESLFLAILKDEPIAPRNLDRSIPRDLETICLKCLAKDRDQRYRSCQDLGDELGRWLRSEPIRARPIGQLERAARWCRRSPVVAGLLASLAFVMLAGTVVSSSFAVVAGRRTREAVANAERMRIERERADDEARRAHRNFYIANMRAAQQAWDGGEAAILEDCLERTRPENTGGEDLRGFEWHYWRHLYDLPLTLKGHADGITRLVFSPDGKIVASGSMDGSVKLWDATRGQELLTLNGHLAWLEGVAFSHGGARAVSASGDGTIKVWDTATGRNLVTITTRGPVRSMAISPDGARIASGSYGDGAVRVFDAATGEERLTLLGNNENGIQSVAFSPNGTLIVSGRANGQIEVWATGTGRKALMPAGHTDSVNSVAFGPDGTSIASASEDGTVKLWDAGSGDERLALRGHGGPVNSVAFSPDGKRIASGSSDGRVKVWWVSNGDLEMNVEVLSGKVTSVSFSPDGRRIAAGSSEATVRIWDAARGHAPDANFIFNGARCVEFSPDGSRIAVSAGGNGEIKIWDAGSGQTLLTLTGHSESVTSVAFSPDGAKIASGSWDKTIKIWDAGSGQTLLTLTGHSESVTSVAFSPDGGKVASGSWDKTIKIWDASTGHELFAFNGHAGPLTSVAFSPDSTQIAAGSNNHRMHPLLYIPGGPLDYRHTSAGNRDHCKVWDLATGQEVLTLNGHAGGVTGVKFSPDGRRIASASVDGTVKLWDSATGLDVLTLETNALWVYGVAFSPDGTRIGAGASWAAGGGAAIVWDARPLGADVRAELEGRALLSFVARDEIAEDEARRRVLSDPWASADVRQRVLSLLDTHYARRKERPRGTNSPP